MIISFFARFLSLAFVSARLSGQIRIPSFIMILGWQKGWRKKALTNKRAPTLCFAPASSRVSRLAQVAVWPAAAAFPFPQKLTPVQKTLLIKLWRARLADNYCHTHAQYLPKISFINNRLSWPKLEPIELRIGGRVARKAKHQLSTSSAAAQLPAGSFGASVFLRNSIGEK